MNISFALRCKKELERLNIEYRAVERLGAQWLDVTVENAWVIWHPIMMRVVRKDGKLFLIKYWS